MRVLVTAIAGLLLGAAGAEAQVVCVDYGTFKDCVINNGLAPPSPDNVIDDTTYSNDYVIVRSAGCPPVWPAEPPVGTAWWPCPSPGEATEIEVTSDGQVRFMDALDSSIVTMDGRVSSRLEAFDTSAVTMNSGGVEGDFIAIDSSTLTLNHLAVVQGDLIAKDSTTITMNGQNSVGLGVWGELVLLGYSTLAMNSGRVGYLYPGKSSAVTMDGGEVVWGMEATGFSSVAMSGGKLFLGASALDSSTITISGGTVNFWLYALDSSAIEMRGGTLDDLGQPSSGNLAAWGSSTITIEGTSFMVDTGSGPVAVPYGDLAAQSGTLTGTLTSGDDIDNVFYQGGSTDSPCSMEQPCSGTITLVPEPSQMLLCGCGLAMLALLRSRAP